MAWNARILARWSQMDTLPARKNQLKSNKGTKLGIDISEFTLKFHDDVNPILMVFVLF